MVDFYEHRLMMNHRVKAMWDSFFRFIDNIPFSVLLTVVFISSSTLNALSGVISWSAFSMCIAFAVGFGGSTWLLDRRN